ncbi:MAG: SGNH/GDSL hydrolase family protein [Solirubrobacterales bacterium]
MEPARTHPRVSTPLLALLASLVIIATAALAWAPAAGAHPKIDYVALGDSYAAGPLIPNQIAVDTPPGCAQSDHNYPHDIAAISSLIDLTDVSCSGARTNDMFTPQTTAAGINPPQLNAVTTKTVAVSLTIGGNDIGFSSIIASCISPVPVGQPCQNLYVTASGDALRQRVDATAPKVKAVLDGIKAKSPHARIVVVGYPDILPPNSPGCWPQIPFTPSDTAYLDGVERYLNDMLRTVARANGAGYGNSYALSVGHDACQTPDVRWVEPLVPVNPAAPAHPNAKGEQAMAGAALLGVLF